MFNKAKTRAAKEKDKVEQTRETEQSTTTIQTTLPINIVKPKKPVNNNTKLHKPITGNELLLQINTEAIGFKVNFLENFELLNTVISDYTIKRKNNIRDLEIMLKRDEERKEKEALMLKKNLDAQVESVLSKANNCLDSIKYLGKNNNKKQLQPLNKPVPSQELSSLKENKKTIFDKLLDKYNDKLYLNENNLKDYFTVVERNKNSLKVLKTKAKKLQDNAKLNQKKFDALFNQNKNNSGLNFIKESQLFLELDNFIKIISIINSDLFLNLYKKVMLSISKEKNDEEIFDIFSFWYILNSLKSIKSNNNKINQSSGIEMINLLNKNPVIEHLSENLKNIFELFSGKEEKTLSEEFYKIYDYLLLFSKIGHLKTALKITNEYVNKKSYNKEELYYFKYMHSILTNNGTFTFQISK
jgi:hypothetical protein